MVFLIDGYNLMYAVGMASKSMVAPKFEKKRGEFLDWLATGLGRRVVDVRVVFDAQQAVGPSPESRHKGIRVRFAYRQTADDVIETLIAAEPRPAVVTVVSNDVRLQDAARHRGCAFFSCEHFIDWLQNQEPTPKPAGPPPPEKPVGPAPAEEVEEWLKVFLKPRPKA